MSSSLSETNFERQVFQSLQLRLAGLWTEEGTRDFPLDSELRPLVHGNETHEAGETERSSNLDSGADINKQLQGLADDVADYSWWQADDDEDVHYAEEARFLLDDFFTLIGGSSVLEEDSRSTTPTVTALQRVATNISVVSSTSTFLPKNGGYGGPLDHLCELVDALPLLQNARIVTCECYTKPLRVALPTGVGLVHRFLLLELERDEKKRIWVRLDRMPSATASRWRFVRSIAQTPAHDTVQVDANKAVLVETAKVENRQQFLNPPTMGQLRALLRVICAELKTYQVWPQNCWFFVSLLQQHLGKIGMGSFVLGHLPSPNIEPRVRRRIELIVDGRDPSLASAKDTPEADVDIIIGKLLEGVEASIILQCFNELMLSILSWPLFSRISMMCGDPSLQKVRGSESIKVVQLQESEIRFLCSRAREIFLTQPVLLPLSAPVTICGDIHGQYFDLLRLFEIGGVPPETNYLFLGDYVNRGKQSMETICLLLAYKIRYPDNFFLLRGNHEAASVTRIYGFYDECQRRYNVKLWKVFVDCFNCLPLAAIVGGRLFAAHGGLSPDLQSMEQIDHITRPTDIPDTGLMCDLLWSDPDSSIDEWSENDRGVSYAFGVQALKRFLVKFDLDVVCRAHQVVEEFFGNQSLVTLFSAPNYCGEFDNVGAVMSMDENLVCSIKIVPQSAAMSNRTFKSPTGRPRTPPPMS